ncbi:MAG: toll/interleukin-1 receptor domain-containing protein [Bacteroidales bacterium]|jgi:nucleoside 2-deoxyribosyltransferase|nr:toll/interleukin-1 receptor domain-containing protein [Bacteroidales bacterium]
MKKIFISYSDLDKSKMNALKVAIDKDSSNIEALVIADQKKPLEVLSEKVIFGINNCDILVPILTNNSIGNQWVNQEIGYAFAKDKRIIPIIADNVFKKLKGFINPQVDCPFNYHSDPKNKRKESWAFRKAYLELLNHVKQYSVQPNDNTMLSSTITPLKIQAGEMYTTKVHFKGVLKHGFFDNYVKHIGSTFSRWNVDRETLPRGSKTDPGILNGSVDISKEYSHSTKDWPKGKYKIHVRIYDHPTPGVAGRIIVDQNVHEIEII